MYSSIHLIADCQYSARAIYGQTICCRLCNCFLLSVGTLGGRCDRLRVPR